MFFRHIYYTISTNHQFNKYKFDVLLLLLNVCLFFKWMCVCSCFHKHTKIRSFVSFLMFISACLPKLSITLTLTHTHTHMKLSFYALKFSYSKTSK